jgi:predicted amidohydrolase
MSTIRIGVAQVPPTPDLGRNRDKALEYMELAAGQGVDLLCFPESHLPGYRGGILDGGAPCDEQALARATEEVAARCRHLSLGVIMGTETPNPGAKPFNSALVLGQDGQAVALHHKTRLTAKEALLYSPGAALTPFRFKGIAMGLVICYEGFRFPEATRSLARAGARVVFHPQFNSIRPGQDWKQPVHEALIVARAAENSLYFVSANMSHPHNNCRSLVVAPDGLVQGASVLGQEMLLVAGLDPALATHDFLQNEPPGLGRP